MGEKLDVAYVARLARLRLTAEETDLFQKQLGEVVGHIEKLERVELSVADEIPVPAAESLRADEVADGLTEAEALANAPRRAENLFIVPRILE